MVQIPIYKSESSPKLTSPVTSGVPNLIGAAMLPYEQVSRLGNTILDVGQKKYEQELQFENQKYEAKLDHDLNLKRLALDFEADEYAIQKQHEIDTLKENESYKTELFKISKSLKAEFEIEKIKIQRETKVKNAVAESWATMYQLSDIASREPNTEVAMANWEAGIKKLKYDLTKDVTDLAAKQLIELELDQNITTERVKVDSLVNKNILDQNELAFLDEVETLKNNVIRNHTHWEVQSLEKLIGENSVIHKRAAEGQLKLNGVPVSSDVYIEAVKKDIFNVMAQNMADDQPKRFKLHKRGGFWDDKLTPEQIRVYDNRADTAIAAEQAAIISNIKNQKSIFNNNVDLFTRVASKDYFGNEATYETLMNNGLKLSEDLLALGLITEAQEVTKHINTLRDKHAIYHVVQNLKHETVPDINAYYFNLKAETNKQGSDPINSVLLGEVEQLKNYVNDKKNSDPIGLAKELWGLQVPQMNWMEKDAASFAANVETYQNQMGFIRHKLGLTKMPIFQPQDIQQINEVFKNGSKEEILLLAQNVTTVSGIYANDAFTELASTSPAMAHLGKLMNMSDGRPTDASQHIVNGWVKLRNTDIANLVGKVNIDGLGFLEATELLTGDALKNVDETAHQINDSAKYIFASMVAESAELRGLITDGSFEHATFVKAHKKSIQLAAGLIQTPDGAKGGFELYNGKPILIPQEKLNGSLKTFDLHKEFTNSTNSPTLELLMDNYLTNDLFFIATAQKSADFMGVQESITFTGSADSWLNALPVGYDFEGRVSEELLAKDFFGDYEKVYLETNDMGEYFLLFGDPGAEHEYYKTRAGQKVVININRILPDLMAAWEADTTKHLMDSSLSSYSTMGVGSGM